MKNCRFCTIGLGKPSTPENGMEDRQSDDDYAYDDDGDDNKSGQDNSSNKESNSVNEPIPYFEPNEYTTSVRIGETAVLDCNVKNLSGKQLKLLKTHKHYISILLFSAKNVIMWQNGTKILTQSRVKVSVDDRVSVDENNSLTITNIHPSDQNPYSCTVFPNNIKMIANLFVQTKPTATIYNSDGRDISDTSITFHQGNQIRVECRGAGRPEPTIKWFSNGERVTGPGIEIVDGVMIIGHADHQHVRLYQCLADNGVEAGHATVSINVQCKFMQHNQLLTLFHYPHSSTQFAYRFAQSIVTPSHCKHNHRRHRCPAL